MTVTPATGEAGTGDSSAAPAARMPRRRLLGAALALGASAAVPLGVSRPSWASPGGTGPLQLVLPAPTGPCPLAFFDQHLRHRPQRLLDGPSPAFPEVEFLP
ncbi:hypothetical protein [Peterkaempfera griseoplana]|uniref:hypothetical protein n=1 Tax=Peterkaempfera griseoplana TaxID=66896 RepID=UPI0006E3A48E|nr:hypothetical protein [Peterkaempfera griseoplana]